jgi:hypothetical protein
MLQDGFKKVYYIYNTDNTQLVGKIPVRIKGVRALNPASGKQEYDRGQAVTAVFKAGDYTCTDPDIASFLDVYHQGGEFTWRNQKVRKEPEPHASFKITSELLVPDGVKTVERTVTKTAIPEFIASSLGVDQLRQACESFGVPFTDITSKQDLLNALKKNGNVA